jgi:putative peptidoglycan lipid II flippase
MALNLVFSFTFSRFFAQIGWMPHGGLALANSLATALEVTTLYFLMRRRLRTLDGKSIGRGFGQAAAGVLAMAIALLVWLHSPGPTWLLGVGGVALGGAVYGLVMAILKVPELQTVYLAIRRRLTSAH